MISPIENQYKSYGTDLALVSTPQNQDGLTIQIVLPPGSPQLDPAVSFIPRAAFPLTGNVEDDIANASWEDAEWC